GLEGLVASDHHREDGIRLRPRTGECRVGWRDRNDNLLEDNGGGALTEPLTVLGQVALHLGFRDRRRPARLLLACDVRLDQPLTPDLLRELVAELLHRKAALAERGLQLRRPAQRALTPLDLLLHRRVHRALVDTDRGVARRGLQDHELVDPCLEQLAAQALQRRALWWRLLRLRDRAEDVFLDVVIQDDTVADDRDHEAHPFLVLRMRGQRECQEGDDGDQYSRERANCRHPRWSMENGNGRRRDAAPATVISPPPERVPAHGCGAGESGCGAPGCCGDGCRTGGTAGRAASTGWTTTGNARGNTSPPYAERSVYESGPSDSTFCCPSRICCRYAITLRSTACSIVSP